MEELTGEQLATIEKLMLHHCLFDLGAYRPPMLRRRIHAQMCKLGLGDAAEYIDLLRRDSATRHALVEAVGINVSVFFRDPLVFQLLGDRVIPTQCRAARARGDRELRVWSAGCGKGEEAYSLAILLYRALAREWDQWRIWVFASDMDAKALATARRGIYPESALGNIPLDWLGRYFRRKGEREWEILPEIRQLVRFAHHDLALSASPVPVSGIFDTFNLVLCRNVLIYFTPEHRYAVLSRLVRTIAAGGCFVLGSSEVLDAEFLAEFQVMDQPCRIFCRRTAAIG